MNISSKKLKPHGMYFITKGDKVGGFLVWIKEYDIDGAYAFLFMPNPMEAIYINCKEVRDGLKDGTIEFTNNILPIDYYNVCVANWKYYADKTGLKYEHK